MGITGYHKWMRLNHPTAFASKWLDKYDHVYIDINFALHYCHYIAKNESEIIGNLIWFLDTIVCKFNPTKSIIIANDGPAPLAKLLLQRERRTNCVIDVENLDSSSLIFTPGTNFMNSIESKLHKFAENIKKERKIRVDFMIGCEGEAELKLKKKMMENMKKSDETHLIVSNDADIIAMFGTFDTSTFKNVYICTNVGVSRSKETEIISFGTLMKLHSEKFGMTKNYGLDFTLLSIMLGNDYLPKISFVDLDKLMISYKNASCIDNDGLVLNTDFKLNIKFLIRILNGVLVKTKKQYANNITPNDYNPSLYANYMDGLLWCLDMYYQGQCTRYNYMYENDEIPHPFALILHIHENPKICDISKLKYPSIDPNLYAVLVLPKKALSLIETKYHAFAEKCGILHEKELCGTCHDYQNKIIELKDNVDECKKIKKEFKMHQNTHTRIVADDILQLLDSAG